MVMFRGGKSSQDRQSPGSMRPGYVSQPHQADPTQAGGLDHMRLAGTYGVSVDTQSADASAAATLDRLVYAEHHRLVISTEMPDQKSQQNSAELKGREYRAVENMVVLGEASIVTESHDPER